ncbi:hypothetical protein D9M68_761570 [compost metagenome]
MHPGAGVVILEGFAGVDQHLGYTRQRSQRTLGQFGLGHLQREHQSRAVRAHGDLIGQAYAEHGLTGAGTAGNDDKVAGTKAAHQVVEVGQVERQSYRLRAISAILHLVEDRHNRFA